MPKTPCVELLAVEEVDREQNTDGGGHGVGAERTRSSGAGGEPAMRARYGPSGNTHTSERHPETPHMVALGMAASGSLGVSMTTLKNFSGSSMASETLKF